MAGAVAGTASADAAGAVARRSGAAFSACAWPLAAHRSSMIAKEVDRRFIMLFSLGFRVGRAGGADHLQRIVAAADLLGQLGQRQFAGAADGGLQAQAGQQLAL